MTTPQLDIEQNAVFDVAGNGIAADTDRTITINDTSPPTFTSAAYSTGSGKLAITFSESLNDTAHPNRLHIRDTGESSGGVTLSGTPALSGSTLTLTLTATQRSAVLSMTTPQLDIEQNAVFDVAGNGIASAADRTITINDTSPPTFTSAAYSTGSGNLAITFSESLNDTAHPNRLHIRDTGESSGGVTLSGTPALSGSTLTLTLTATQRSAVLSMTTPQLDIEQNAVFDVAGNGIASAADRTITINDTSPPVITILGSNPVTITVGDDYDDKGATCRDETDGTRIVTTDNQVVNTRVGNYKVTYSCSDSSDNDASAVRTVRVRGDPSDIIVETPTIPVITILGSNPAYIGGNQTYSDAGATCSDSFNDRLPVRTTHSVDTSEQSTHTVTYTCSNGWHHPQTATRTVIVSGGTSGVGSAPTIHLLAQGGTYYGGTYTFKDYNCVDPEDGIINHRVKVSVAAGTSTATITYTCTDRNDNITTATRTVPIADNRPPVVSINGAREVWLSVGDDYDDEGATCTDDRDASSSATLLGNNVDTTAPGRYYVDYLCEDSQGGSANDSRVVTVVAANVNIRPVVSVPVEAIYLNVNDSYTLPTPTCTDAEDKDLSDSVVTDGANEVNVSKVGTYEVFFICTDSEGAMAATSVVIYVDKP